MLTFKDALRTTFQQYKQVEEISNKIIECVVVFDVKNGVVRFADYEKLATMIEFMKCFPMLVNRDKNNSAQGVGVIMTKRAPTSPINKLEELIERRKLAKVDDYEEQSTTANLEYVRQLISLIFSRIEDKHKNVTEMFRFMDQRGQGKIDKKDFHSAVERMRISLSRDDANKVWNYLDMNGNGHIQLQEVSQAYENKLNNFGGKV